MITLNDFYRSTSTNIFVKFFIKIFFFRFDRQRIRSNLFDSSNDIPDSNHIQIGSDDPKSHNNIFIAKNQLELEQMLLKESHNGEQGKI